MRRLVLLGAVLGTLVFAVGVAQAQSGAVDPTFGNGGIADLPAGVSVVQIATQQDGKIVGVGGTCISDCGTDLPKDALTVVGYNADGSLDSGFGTDGVATTPLGSDSFANGVVIQSDGKIVVVGETEGKAVVLRYLPNGRLDKSFGTAGSTLLSMYGIFSFGTFSEVALQTDGKIVIGGEIVTGDLPSALLVARLGTDGAMDTSFGNKGLAETPLSHFVFFQHALEVQPDGKILVGADGESFLQLARYEPDGSLDPGFGTGGLVSLTTQDSSPVGFAFQDGGTFIVGATPFIGGNFALARFHEDGSLDLSFGTNGFVITQVGGPIGAGSYGEAYAMSVDSMGRILLAGESGYAEPQFENFSAFVRYNPDGSLDPSFGTDGILASAFNGLIQPEDIVLQPDERVVSLTRTGSARVLTRYLQEPGYNLTVGTSGNGSGLVGDPQRFIVCPQLCSNTLAAGTRITLSANPDPGTKFVGWSGACSGKGTCELTMDASHSVSARFALAEKISVRLALRGGGGGKVLSSPPGIDCGSTCTATFLYGAQVTLTAQADAHSIFLGWGGACLGWLISPCPLTMTSDQFVTAVFAKACIVPNTRGKQLPKAKRALRRSHCGVGSIRTARSRTVQRGRVISQHPKPRRKVLAGSRVSLVVSR